MKLETASKVSRVSVGEVRSHPKKKNEQLFVKQAVLDTEKGTLSWRCVVLRDAATGAIGDVKVVPHAELKATRVITAPAKVPVLSRGQVRLVEVAKGPPHLVWLDQELPPGDAWMVFHVGSDRRDLYYSVLLAGSEEVDLVAYLARRSGGQSEAG